jgi:acyl-CoA dehydrogenase
MNHYLNIYRHDQRFVLFQKYLIFIYNLKSTAIPKIRTGIASGKVIALSHQVHGAMGFTKEYELSYFTKALNSWRNEFGNEIYWQNILGKLFLNQNKNFWEFLNN